MRKRKETAFILMADDDQDDFMLTRDALKEAGYKGEIRLVEDGGELMDYLHGRGKYGHSSAPCPDLILLDLNMPTKNGRIALQEMKSNPKLRGIPIVILTTSQEKEDIRFCYDTGANAFMTKPIDFNEWTEGMRVLISYWFDWMRLPPKNKTC